MPQLNKTKSTSAPAKPVAKPVVLEGAPPSGEVVLERKVLYPEVYVMVCSSDVPLRKGMIQRASADEALFKKLLGWESEKEYTLRRQKETGLSAEECKFPDDLLPPPFEDEEGNKVVCWNNCKNRPFDINHARKLAQDILNKNWALNLENVIISKYGTVVSGQHRGIGLILACQLWRGPQKLHWRETWPNAPTIDLCIAFGCSEDPKVLQTLDNVKPRTEADVFYTSPLFADLGHSARNECSRMLARAVDLLWKRTGAGEANDKWNHYQTHSASKGFLSRHMRLLEAVKYLFDINNNGPTRRKLTSLGFSTGHCAAMLYLMAASRSDDTPYRMGDRTESDVNFELWDEAKAFWKALASEQLKPLWDGILGLYDADTGAGGRLTEKMALVAKAWRGYLAHNGNLDEEDCRLQYDKDQMGRTVLAENPDFGGIDVGFKLKQADDEEEVEKAKDVEKRKKEEERAKSAERMEAAVAAGKRGAGAGAGANGGTAGKKSVAKGWPAAKK